MTVPVVARLAREWLERGSMQVKFHQPFYEGEEVVVRAEVYASTSAVKISVTASREGGSVCASGIATVNENQASRSKPRLDDYPERPLPPDEARPQASRENIAAGSVLGTLIEEIDLRSIESTLLPSLNEQLSVYYGADAVAHPTVLLAISNHVLMRNFDLGPWIHTASDVTNWSAARHGERISASARVRERFERKGHEYVVLDVILTSDEGRLVQQVRHTAIYRPRLG
jgi:acyl dehydratase